MLFKFSRHARNTGDGDIDADLTARIQLPCPSTADIDNLSTTARQSDATVSVLLKYLLENRVSGKLMFNSNGS